MKVGCFNMKSLHNAINKGLENESGNEKSKECCRILIEPFNDGKCQWGMW